MDLFDNVRTRSEVVATFLAVLELCKTNRIKISDDASDISLLAEEKQENRKNRKEKLNRKAAVCSGN